MSPFGTPLAGQPLVATLLTGIGFTGALGLGGYSFVYNSSGELTQANFPHRGYFRYSFAVDNLANPTRQTRVLANRYVSQDGTTASERSYWFLYPGGDNSLASHSQVKLWDASGNEKIWYFIHGSSNGWDNGLEYQMDTLSFDGQTTPVRRARTTWTQDNLSVQTLTNPRVSSVATTLEDGVTQSMAQQDLDSNGNVIAKREYAFGNLSTPYRTTTTTYLTGTGYTNANILNRPIEIKVCTGVAPCSGANVASDTTIAYDTMALGQYGCGSSWRANPNQVTANGIYTTQVYDCGGNVMTAGDALGHLILRMVTGTLASPPKTCSDRYDAMDLYPPPTQASRGGDGMIDTLDLLAALRKVTNVDAPATRTSPATTCAGAALQSRRAAPRRASEGTIEISGNTLYLLARSELNLAGLALSIRLPVPEGVSARFVPGDLALSVDDPGQPGAIVIAWLSGIHLAVNDRLLLGYVQGASRFSIGTVSANEMNGRAVPITVAAVN